MSERALVETCSTSEGSSPDAVSQGPSSSTISILLPPPPPFGSRPEVRQRVDVPLSLPPKPLHLKSVNLDELILDDDLAGVPSQYLVEKLVALGLSLLDIANRTKIRTPNRDEGGMGEYLNCTPPPETDEIHSGLHPTHVLSISSDDEPLRRLLLPVHGLSWASHSTYLHFLSSAPDRQSSHPLLPLPPKVLLVPAFSLYPRRLTHLPVIPIHLPSSQSVPILQTWIYLLSEPHLLASLLPRFQPSNGPPMSHASTLIHSSTLDLLSSLKRIQGLWQDSAALGVNDRGLWETMETAWDMVIEVLRERAEVELT